MSTRIRRPLAALSALLAAVAMSFLIAGPAQADKSECTQYLKETGYPNIFEMGQACGFASENGQAGLQRCINLLVSVRVTRGEAVSACLYALA